MEIYLKIKKMKIIRQGYVKEDFFYLKKNILYDFYHHSTELNLFGWSRTTYMVNHGVGTTSVDKNDIIFLDEIREEKLNTILNY